MKVLHILPMDKLSGAEKLALEICKNMKEYEPIVVCGGEELRKCFVSNNIESYSIEFDKVKFKNSIKGLKNIIRDNNVDIVHAHDNNASLKAYVAKKLYRLDVKVISHIHNCYPWLVGRNKNKIIDFILRRRYDYNIACGKLVYDFYTKNTNYVHEKNTVILSNAIDVQAISNSRISDLESIYNEFNIPRDKTILGFIGRLSEQKGIIPFVKEVAKNKDKFSDCKILLVGSGDQEEEVRKIIKSNNMEDLFILIGYQDDVYKFYPTIDVFFLPSLYEGLPMVVLEAMAFNKPVISMNVGSIDEVIKDSYNGYVVDKGNYGKFIDKLSELKNSKELQIKYGINGHQYVLKNYDINNYIDNLIKVYDKLFFKSIL